MTVVTSTGSISALAEETNGWDNLAPTAGSWRNIFWDAAVNDMRWGKFFGKFLFDFERVALRFSNITPPIPHTAVILKAFVRGTGFATSDTSTFFTVIQVLNKDGIWNLASKSGWRSASAVGTNTDMDVLVLSTLGGTMVDTGVPIHANWPIRDNAAGRYLRAGQGVTVGTAGTLGFVDISVERTGAVAVGDIFCEIYSQDANGLADALLATSDTRAASTAPTTMAPFRFTFSGLDQIALASGQGIVVVLNGDYPISASDNIGVGWNRGIFSPGTFQLDGTGVVFDDQNYPMMDSFRTINPSPGFIIWIAPQFILGVDEDTPDFTRILQTYIENGVYTEGDPIGISIARSNAFFPSMTAQRQWAQFGHPTFGPIRLIVEWDERDVSDASHVRTIQAEASHVMIAPASASHDRIVASEASHRRVVGAEASHVRIVPAQSSHVEDAMPAASFIPVIQSEASHVRIVPAQASHVMIVNAGASHERIASGEASHVQVINAEASQEI